MNSAVAGKPKLVWNYIEVLKPRESGLHFLMGAIAALIAAGGIISAGGAFPFHGGLPSAWIPYYRLVKPTWLNLTTSLSPLRTGEWTGFLKTIHFVESEIQFRKSG